MDARYKFVVQTLSEWSSRTPSKYPFPRLRSLRCAARTNKGLWDISSLLPPNLDHFSFTAPDLSPAYFHKIYQSLTSNRTDLYFLAFDLRPDARAAVRCIPLLEQLLEKFAHSLTWVQLPEVFITPSVITRLANIKNLCNLAIGMPDASDSNPTLITKGYAGANGWGNFSVLRQFSYYDLPSRLYDTFLLRHDLTSVSSFHWDFDTHIQADIKSLFTNICRLFPLLTSLHLGNSEMYDSRDVEIDDIPLLEWSSLRPVLACRHLTELALHALRVSITRQQLIDFLKDRASWERLELYTEEPFDFQEVNLFAQHCPNLRQLGIHFDLTYREDYLDHFGHTATFHHLVSIDFAYSVILDNFIHIVGRYFYEICENPPRLDGWNKRTWDDVAQCIADLYVDEATKTGLLMSPEARAYVDKMESNWLMELDSKSGDSSEEEEDDDDEMGYL